MVIESRWNGRVRLSGPGAGGAPTASAAAGDDSSAPPAARAHHAAPHPPVEDGREHRWVSAWSASRGRRVLERALRRAGVDALRAHRFRPPPSPSPVPPRGAAWTSRCACWRRRTSLLSSPAARCALKARQRHPHAEPQKTQSAGVSAAALRLCVRPIVVLALYRSAFSTLSNASMSFHPDAADARNQYDDDAALRSPAGARLPAEGVAEVSRRCGRWGSSRRAVPAQLAHLPHEPRPLVRVDAWGNRVDRIELTPLWLRAERIAAEHGVVAAAYEHAHAASRALHQFALAYLFTPSTTSTPARWR